MYISCCGISCYVKSFGYKAPENTEEEPDDPEPADKKRYPNGILL
jgi:hypothetical protein